MSERKGSCNRCGLCCEVATRCLTKDSPELQEWADTRDIEIQKDDNPGMVALLIRQPCPNLVQTSDGATCRIYSIRPDMCMDGPTRPEDILPGCGFWFE